MVLDLRGPLRGGEGRAGCRGRERKEKGGKGKGEKGTVGGGRERKARGWTMPPCKNYCRCP